MCSPSSGGAVRIAPGRRGRTRSGCRPGGGRRGPGARPRPTCPSAAASGESKAARTSAIGPLGTSAASRAAQPSRRSARVGQALGDDRAQRVAVVDAVAVRREARVRGERRQRRSPRRTAATGAPTRPPRRARRRRWRTSRTGRCSGGRCRAGRGESPVTNAFWAWLTRTASVEPSSDTSTRWPGPARRGGPAGRPGCRSSRTARSRRR